MLRLLILGIRNSVPQPQPQLPTTISRLGNVKTSKSIPKNPTFDRDSSQSGEAAGCNTGLAKSVGSAIRTYHQHPQRQNIPVAPSRHHLRFN
ncbi:hypothetical protein E2C01_057540 [Portunus trituberculatus]|uniref:Uncharacterized protein n=1 Tax=Portunus trituberculatus TaxID=210409 RepID=A0A5B7GX32_PORTR|nr:hypothetical protein [Portunus trituberculatus]